MRNVWIALLMVGVLLGVFAGARTVSATQVGTPGRYEIVAVQYGERGHSVAVVLDTATGQVTPYVVGTNNSIDHGALRLFAFRVIEK
jgi:hypothetical protein